MQDLTLVGLSEDKSKLILVSDSGEEYTLPADAKLRAALRGDHARLGQLEIQMDSALRPRDIQARIRSGESPETVAQAAQTTVDRIMTYASPVLAERAHIADRAQRASVRRKAGEGPARLLGDAVAEQLRSRNVDPESVEWDSWRRGDGRWTLVADYRLAERPKHAVFTFDVQGRYVVAEDDESKWLVGEQVPARKTQSRAGSPRRLSAVSAEEELPLGDDAIELVTGAGGTDGHEPTVELRPAGDADWIATQATDRPTAAVPPRREGAPVTRTADGADASEDEAADSSAARPEDQQAAEARQENAEQAEPQPKKSGRKGRRASVPSWDEIMFGGGRSD